MTIHLHWWVFPLLLALGGLALIPFVRSEGSYVPYHSWHLVAALLLLFAAFCTFVGGLIA